MDRAGIIKSIIKYLSKDCYYVKFESETDLPSGEKQPSDHYLFQYEWVDQRCGCSEDDYYGWIFFPYEGKYLKFYYRA